jgi:thermospermine synthase
MLTTEQAFASGNWYHEQLEDGLTISYEVKKVFHRAKSVFQQVEVVETVPFGRALITDRLMQSAYSDEHVYHESLVQPALCSHPNPKRVFIGGGGEGATLREVLTHPSVEECVMVDIDGDVVQFCRDHMPEHSAGAFDNPRTKLIIDDCKAQLEGYADGSFDVIIMDLSDPLDGGPCYQLYTTTFYTTIKAKLAPGGLFVTQSGCGSTTDAQRCFTCVHSTMKAVFDDVWGYTAHVPSFSSEWGFNIACKEKGAHNLQTIAVDGVLDKRIADRGLDTKLQWYDGVTHTRMFSLGKQVRKFLANEKRVMTVENPLFMTTITGGCSVSVA